MSENLVKLISNFLELKMLHAKRELANVSQLRKARVAIARAKTLEVKNG